MADVSIEFDTIFSIKGLEKLGDNTELNRRVLDGAAAILLRRNRERFLRAVDPDGKPWLVSRQAQIRAAGGTDLSGVKDTGRKTLFSTGSLFNSIQVLRKLAGQNERRIGVNPTAINTRSRDLVMNYAVQHQSGTGGGPGIVKREFIGVGKQDVPIVEKFLLKEIEALFK